MANKPATSIPDQILLLKQRGMLFHDEALAAGFLANVSYYRLKGYWWDMQADRSRHTFLPKTFFEEIVDRYNFDRDLRLIVFDAIERIEVALRTRMVNILSQQYGGLWYLDHRLFESTTITGKPGARTIHQNLLDELFKEFNRSQEVFIKDQRQRYPNHDADAWKIMEVASMGTLSKLYKTLRHQLPEKALIAHGMGLRLHNELSSWLEAISYVRNIAAHHSRLWSRNMVKTPAEKIKNPIHPWFNRPLEPVQSKKVFLILSCMLYLCNHVAEGNHIKQKILALFAANPNIQLHKLGFLNDWQLEPIWRT
jgi:abortive infection bacteriophage resistance protein